MTNTTNPLEGLFLEWKNNTPAGTILQFTNPTGVKNFYGWNSVEATLANEFFKDDPTGANGTIMEFTRVALGQRPHMLGANLAGQSIQQIDAIHGSLAVGFNGWKYNANVDLAGAATYQDAAAAIQVALNAHRETVATTTGSYWTKEEIAFNGSVDRAQLTSDTQLVIGGIVSGKDLGPNEQIINDHGIDPITGLHLNSFFTNTGDKAVIPTEQMVETYYLFHPGTVTSGSIQPGEQIRTNGLNIADGLPPSAVIGGSDNTGWVVNTIPDGLGPNLSLEAPPLSVGLNWQNKDITDRHGNITEAELNVMPNGNFGFDNYPSIMDPYFTGTAAAALGLSEGEAIPPGPGGSHETMSHFMTDLTHMPGGDFSRVHTQQPRFVTSLTNWVDLNPGHYLDSTYLSTAPADQPPPGHLTSTWGRNQI